MQKILDVRESKLLQMSQESIELHDTNQELQRWGLISVYMNADSLTRFSLFPRHSFIFASLSLLCVLDQASA